MSLQAFETVALVHEPAQLHSEKRFQVVPDRGTGPGPDSAEVLADLGQRQSEFLARLDQVELGEDVPV